MGVIAGLAQVKDIGTRGMAPGESRALCGVLAGSLNPSFQGLLQIPGLGLAAVEVFRFAGIRFEVEKPLRSPGAEGEFPTVPQDIKMPAPRLLAF